MVLRSGLLALLVIGVLCAVVGTAAAGAGMRVHVGLSYASGLKELYDLHEENLEAQGYEVEMLHYSPLGASVQPYYEWDGGLGLGGAIGPIELVWIEGGPNLLNIPLGVDVRYAFFPESAATPYVRVGPRVHLASGDYVEGTAVGFFAAGGLEIARQGDVAFGFEVGFDSAEVELESWASMDTETVNAIGLVISGCVVFRIGGR